MAAYPVLFLALWSAVVALAAACDTRPPAGAADASGVCPVRPAPDPTSLLQTSMTTHHLAGKSHLEGAGGKDGEVRGHLDELIAAQARADAAAKMLSRYDGVGQKLVQDPTNSTGSDNLAADLAGVSSNSAEDLSAFLSALVLNIGILLFCVLFFSGLRKLFPMVYQHKVEQIYVESLVAELQAQGADASIPSSAPPSTAAAPQSPSAFSTMFSYRGRKGTQRAEPQLPGPASASGAAADHLPDPAAQEQRMTKGPGGRPMPVEPPDTLFGWILPSLRLTIDDVEAAAGLDHAMLIEYTHLAMRIIFWLALPSLLLLMPLHIWAGGQAAGDDKLSYMGFNNVLEGSWICWLQAGMVWYVVGMTQLLIFRAMRSFIPRRYAWMKEMPDPRSNTILVEALPDEMKTPGKIREYFDGEVFGRQVVREVYVVKDTTELAAEIAKLERLRLEAERSDGRVRDGPSLGAQIRAAEADVARLQNYVESTNELNSNNAFVTFHNRREANIAVKLFGEDDMEKILATAPPDPADVIWTDLTVNPTAQVIREYIGFVCIIALFFCTMPLVIGATALTNLDTLSTQFPSFGTFVELNPWFGSLWQGLVGSIGLNLIMGFQPTFIRLIFSTFFVLKAQAWMQRAIQMWYFYILLVFVLLVTTLGQGVMSTLNEIAQSPMLIFSLLGQELPKATHFYMNYYPVQWSTQGINLTRYIQLGKYLVFKMFYSAKVAHELSEPEDQDYYGMGSRSARFTLLLVMALVFSTMCPLILPLAFVNFAICRLFFSYLFVFAETRKPDLGGEFWVLSLKHTQQGLILFVLAMVGVLMQKSTSWVPAVIAIVALFPLWISYNQFIQDFRWEALDFKEAEESQQTQEKTLLKYRTYKQPELPQPPHPKEEQVMAATGGRLQLIMGGTFRRVC